MARKEINVFSVSFLDLLSGALAAVIILFVVIPKMNSEQVSKIETLDSLNVQVDELDSLLELARNSIPDSIFFELESRMNQLQTTVDSLTRQVQRQTQQLADCEENRQEIQQQLDETRQQLEEAQERIREMEEQQSRRPPVNNRTVDQTSGVGQSMFGVNAKFAIVCSWPEDLDVDLYMLNASGEKVYYGKTSLDFGTYLGDVRQRRPDEDVYEMIYQKEIKPGTYKIYYHLYSSSGTAEVSGYAVMFPFTAQEIKVNFPIKTIQHTSTLIYIGSLTIEENSFRFE